MQNIRSCGAITFTPIRQHLRHIGGSARCYQPDFA
jgi:hypothetical protein